MQIDLIYPKIPENSDKVLNKCWAFDKVDGTNCFVKWNVNDGFHTFGTRRTAFEFNRNGLKEFAKFHHEISDMPLVFNDLFRDKLNLYFANDYIISKCYVILFMEYYGADSFAGMHNIHEDHILTPFDMMLNNQMMNPENFYKHMAQFNCARLVYVGKYNGQFAEDVRNGKYNVNEGVVIKGIVDKEVFMTKVKTNAYLKRLEGK